MSHLLYNNCNFCNLILTGYLQDLWSWAVCDLQKYIPSDIVVDSDDEILVLAFDEALSVGNGVLEISFSGVLNEHLKGFYRWCPLFFP